MSVDRAGVYFDWLAAPGTPQSTRPLRPPPGPPALFVNATAKASARTTMTVPGPRALSPHASATAAITMTVQVPVVVAPQPLSPTARAAAAAQAIVITTSALPQLTLTQVAADNFNRANGPLGGSNGWLATADGNPTIISNEASGVGAALAGAYRTEGYTGDQYAQGTVGSVNNVSNDFVGLTLRHNATTNAEYGLLYYFNGSTPVFNVYYRLTTGAYTLIKGITLGGPLAVGTVIEFYVIGNVLVALINGVPQIALVDNQIPPGGAPGLITFGTMTLDNYQCGNASMGMPLGPPIASDNFNRTNGAASSGQAGWTPVTVPFSGVASSDGVIITNELNVSDSQHHTAMRNEVYDPDQWAQLGVGSVPPTAGGPAFVGTFLRWNGTQGYMFCYFLSPPSYRIYFIKTGTNSALLASVAANPAVPNPTGTNYTGVAKGTRLSIQVNTCEVISVTDTQCAAGQPGYQIFPTTTADNFTCGNVTAVAPSGPVAVTGTARAAAAATATIFAPGAQPLTVSAAAKAAATATVYIPSITPTLTLNQVASDNFVRANGSVGGSNNWANNNGSSITGSWVISGNAAQYTGGAGQANMRTETYSPDQYSEMIVGDISPGGMLLGPTTRNSAGGAFVLAGYQLFGGHANDGNYAIWISTSGNLTAPVHNGVSTANPHPGDVLRLVSKGNRHTIFVNGVPVYSLVDNTLTTGTPGIFGAGTVTSISGWDGGNVVSVWPTPQASDNFNRANGNMSSGQPGWATQAGVIFSGVAALDPTIVSNQINVAVVGGGGPNYGAVRTDVTSPNQWSAIQVGTIPIVSAGNGFVGVTLRINSTGGAPNSGYLVCQFGPVSAFYQVYRLDNGVAHLLGQSGGVPDPPGVQLAGTAVGNQITLWADGVPVVVATDSAYATGAAGIQEYPQTGGTTADNWSGGNL